jgi:hypothetical protein
VWLLVLALSARAEWTPPVQLSGTGGNAEIAEDGRGDVFAVWQECRSGCSDRVVIGDYLTAGGSSWQPPVQISTGEESYLPQITGDFSGNGIAVWDSHTGPQSAVRAAPAGAWRTPAPIGGASGEAYDLRVAVDRAGDAVAVWQRDDFAIEAAFRRAATGQWEAPVVVSAAGERSYEPQVAIREGGEVAAVWRVSEPETVPCWVPSGVPCERIVKNRDDIKAASKPGGATWQAPVTITSAQAAGEPRIALDGTGNATALWRANTGGNRTIESSQRPAGDGWLPTAVISSAPLPYVANELDSSLQLVVDGRGEATAAWVHQYQTTTGELSGGGVVETAVGGAGGSWQAPTVISGPDRSAQIVRLTENESGTAAAVWECSVFRHYPTSVRGTVRPGADGRWQPGVEISAPEGEAPEIAAGPDGKAVAIWQQGGPFTTPAPSPGIYTSGYEASLGVPGVPQSDTCAPPALSRVRMIRKRFRVARAPTAINAKRAAGTAFLFNLSTTASVTVAFSRLATGLERGHLCLAPTNVMRHTRAKKCHRTVAIKMLTRRSEPAGEDRIPFTGRLGERPLRPGNYQAHLTATNAAGSSPAAVIRFKINP